MVVEMSIIAQNIADKPIKVEFQTMIIRSKQVEKKELMFSAKIEYYSKNMATGIKM